MTDEPSIDDLAEELVTAACRHYLGTNSGLSAKDWDREHHDVGYARLRDARRRTGASRADGMARPEAPVLPSMRACVSDVRSSVA